MRLSRPLVWLLVAVFLAPLSGAARSAFLAPPTAGFAVPPFGALWARTDKPTADKMVARSWVWGPEPGATRAEPWAGAPGNGRVVQYFDKARMEVNEAATPGSPWAVTTGLLVVELVSGRMQTGPESSEGRAPAEVPVAGDPDPPGAADPLAPVYRSFAAVAALPGSPPRPLPDRSGAVVTDTINRAGLVGNGPQAGVRYQTYVPETGHNIPDVFWRWMHSEGPVWDGAKLVQAPLFDWVYLLGYPITEPYWAVVRVNGVAQRVLVQLYQRRVLTYTPANDAAWQVQMGNVGAHYYDWRYGAGAPALTPSPAPAPTGGDGFVTVAGGELLYAGAPVTLKGTNWWKHDTPFAETWVDWDGPQALEELAKAHELGVNTIRVGLPYDNKGSAKVLWGCVNFDECGHEAVDGWIVNEMHQLLQIASVYGMKVIFSLFDWSDSFPPPGSPEYRIHNTYLQGLITPFANDDRVLAWELHNEPDNYTTWTAGSPERVIGWAQQTAATIKALDRRHPITVGVGNVANLWRPGPGGVTLLDISDIVSFHSYDAGALGAQIRAVRERTNKPIFLGEMGWPSGPEEKSTAQATFSEERQNYLYTTMLAEARAANIAGLAQWTLFDYPSGITTGYRTPSIEENFGLFRFDGSPKPAAALFRDGYSGRSLPSLTRTAYRLTRDKQRPGATPTP